MYLKFNNENNEGFSLVELIVVIAIMVVLVVVLAPVFTKYVEKSRRSKDVFSAAEIEDAIRAEIANGTFNYADPNGLLSYGQLQPSQLSTLTEIPRVRSNAIDKEGIESGIWAFYVQNDKVGVFVGRSYTCIFNNGKSSDGVAWDRALNTDEGASKYMECKDGEWKY